MRPPGSRPQRPRLIPLSTTSRYRAASCAHLADHLLGRRAAAAAAHEGNDAERAAVIAAVLDLEVGARAVARRVLHRRGQEIVLREDIADLDLAVVRRR